MQLFFLMLAVTVGLSSGAEALQIRRVGISQVPGLEDEATEHEEWDDNPPRYSALQALSLPQDGTEEHAHQYEGAVGTKHTHQKDFAHHQYESQPSLASLAISPRPAQMNLRVCPTEIGIKVRLAFYS